MDLLTDILLAIITFILYCKLNKLEESIKFFKKINDSKLPVISNYRDNIDNMTLTEFISFIKERFNLPDYCKMCNNFNPIDSNKDICRFKGLTETKCKEGFKKWLESSNNFEGDMNADIN